ncbi:unnamed protein product [Didymodactylos carnosus]|uniref:Uncharacterized protein n=3 Tax=Didymodactylos carnosus TaxID=1234261 RepID=A0A8S2ES50_9BILA|nr:unnamed protein product [Didymodactylos carnosus]CAF4033697.1 unnamed protein product [Didymodactylos carnosus]
MLEFQESKIDAFNQAGQTPEIVEGEIEFQNVQFTFPTRKEVPVLNDISIKIPSEKTVALVGASGCGKSTIIQLLQRLYDPQQGKILLDGRDIRTLNVAWLRTHVGTVSQEPVLFTGSIEENIKFGKMDASDDEVIAAAKMANAHDFIMELPENYKTTSSDKLSGGQKQRDNTSERIVQDALEKAKLGRTTIIIAHRLSTIRNVDLIITLANGRVVQYGTHNELMQEKGLYYELVTAQQQSEIDKKDEDNDDEIDPAEEERMIRRASIYHRQKSIVSLASIHDEDNDNELFGDTGKKSTFFHRPFLLKILRFNAAEWYYIVIGATVSLIYGGILPAFALIFAQIVKLFAEPNLHRQEHDALIYTILIFFMGCVGTVCLFVSSIMFAKSGEELTMRMRKLTFSAILRQEIGWFDIDVNSVGALVTRLQSDASALKAC